MTREQYESLPLAALKDIAKNRNIKGLSGMKKSDLIDAMIQLDEKGIGVLADIEETKAPQKDKTANADKNSDAGKKRRADKNAKADNADKSGKAAKADKSLKSDNNQKADEALQADMHQKADNSKKADKKSKAEEDLDKPEAKSQAEAQSQSASNDEISEEKKQLDSGEEACGILEVLSDGYGFIRSANYLPGENDVYVAPSQIRRFGLKTGDIIVGNTRVKSNSDKFGALLFVKSINGLPPQEAAKRKNFEDLTPVFPDERLHLEVPGGTVAMRIMDLMSPVGKGQRGMIVSPPKAGKTTLLKDVARSVTRNNPEMYLIILLIDERPEEVTDIKEAITGDHVEVIYSTFDETPEHHRRVSEMVIERAKRLVEQGEDVIILLDSITRLTRAYNMTVPASGRTLSGGLDPAALHMPKRFFGAARNMREGGSLTILATALIETGSKMDDVVYEEFKGTGNMEMVLDRKLSEKRVFPAIDIPRSGTRRDDLLLSPEELEAINIMRKAINGLKPDEAVEKILDMFVRTRNNREYVEMIKKIRIF